MLIVSILQAISPNSQEKLCMAMKSAELSDDVDRYSKPIDIIL